MTASPTTTPDLDPGGALVAPEVREARIERPARAAPPTSLLHALARPLDLVDGWLRRAERERGLAGATLAAVALAVAASLLSVWPSLRPYSFGVEYAKLSLHPLDLHGGSAFHFRILSPLLGYLSGLRGDRFVLFPLLVSWVFLGVVFVAARRRFGLAPWAAFAVVFTLATTTPILFLHQFPGYTDSLSYLLLFLAYLAIPRPAAAVFFALALLNHESSVFLLPFLLATLHLRAPSLRGKIVPALALLLAFAPALAWRHYAKRMVPQAVIGQSTVILGHSPPHQLLLYVLAALRSH